MSRRLGQALFFVLLGLLLLGAQAFFPAASMSPAALKRSAAAVPSWGARERRQQQQRGVYRQRNKETVDCGVGKGALVPGCVCGGLWFGS